jgi:hypothetical protein
MGAGLQANIQCVWAIHKRNTARAYFSQSVDTHHPSQSQDLALA